jgi:putative aldouronate transport system substrate-binding protein
MRVIRIAIVLVVALACVVPLAAAPRTTLKIPVYDRSRPELPPVDDNFWTTWVQSEFGDKNDIDVQYIAIPRQESTAKYNTLIAANDCTDLIMDYDMPVAMSFYKMGALKALDMNKVNSLAPNYVKFVGKNTLAYGVVDGKQVFLPALRPLAYNWMSLIRQDWLDQVGKKVPTNLAEYNAVLKAFKAANLGIPLATSLPNAYYGAYAFRTEPVSEKDLALYSDVSYAALTWKPVMENLKLDNQRYNDGLISPEFYLDREAKTALADWVAGRAGVYLCYLSPAGIIQPLIQNVPTAKVSFLPTSTGFPAGKKVTGRAYWPFGMLDAVYVNSKNEDGVLKLLNWMADSKNLFTFQNGFEGKHYTLSADGMPVPDSAYKGTDSFMYNFNKDMWCAVIEGKDYGSPAKNLTAQKLSFAPKGFDYLIDASYKDWTAVQGPNVYPDFLWKSAPTWNDLQASLRDKWQQIYVALVTAKPADFDALYKKSCEEYLAAGYQRVLDEKLAMYKKQTGK